LVLGSFSLPQDLGLQKQQISHIDRSCRLSTAHECDSKRIHCMIIDIIAAQRRCDCGENNPMSKVTSDMGQSLRLRYTNKNSKSNRGNQKLRKIFKRKDTKIKTKE